MIFLNDCEYVQPNFAWQTRKFCTNPLMSSLPTAKFILTWESLIRRFNVYDLKNPLTDMSAISYSADVR